MTVPLVSPLSCISDILPKQRNSSNPASFPLFVCLINKKSLENAFKITLTSSE